MPRTSFILPPSSFILPLLTLPALVSAQSSVLSAQHSDKPNILILSAEDISPDLHCYGDEYAVTPNLDRLAAQGVRFTRAFSTAPVCSPSRCSIITGTYATVAGGQNHRSDVVPPQGVKCFTEYLRAAGYFCTNNAKTDYNFDPPLTAWDENGPRAHWRHRPDKSQPFLAVFNFNVSHESRAMNLNNQFTHVTDSLTAAERHDPAKARLPAYYPDTPKVRENWARYCDLITVLDHQIQDRLDELAADGLADDTLVVFWGDHGRCLPRGKRWAYDSGLRVPFILRWPGHIPAGSVRDDLATLMDQAPTFLSLANVPVPPYMQGRILLGDHQQPAPQYVFATRDRMDETFDQQRSARDTRYRYTKNLRPDLPYAQHNRYMDHSPIMQEWRRLAAANELSGPPALFFAPTKPAEELYDLATDPDEIHNLATDPAQQETLARFRAALADWTTKTHDPGLTPEADLQKQMRPTGKKATTAPPTAAVDPDHHLTLTTPTPGASIAWTTETTRRPHWHLYTTPLPFPTTPLRALACRPGYADSPEITYTPN